MTVMSTLGPRKAAASSLGSVKCRTSAEVIFARSPMAWLVSDAMYGIVQRMVPVTLQRVAPVSNPGQGPRGSAADLLTLWRWLPGEGLSGPRGGHAFRPGHGTASPLSLCRMLCERVWHRLAIALPVDTGTGPAAGASFRPDDLGVTTRFVQNRTLSWKAFGIRGFHKRSFMHGSGSAQQILGISLSKPSFRIGFKGKRHLKPY